MTNLVEKHYQFENPEQEIGLVGPQDANLKLLEEGMQVEIAGMGASLKLTGSNEAVEQTYAIIDELCFLIKKGIRIAPADIISAMNMAQRGTLPYFAEMYNETVIRDAKGRPIRVKNYSQRQYVQAINQADVTFGVGPAGTGKTYLAVAMAVAALKRGDIERLVITRPAVEAGENLGFLPGDLKEKVDPYLRPIYDALFSILGKEHTERLIDREVIEIAPLAYMRGRTLDNAFIILDEAQNTTHQQMKMFLTRLGFGSKMVVNGDVTQIDLPKSSQSGLIQAQQVLSNVPHIQIIEFDAQDVVRHPVVAKIVAAYQHFDEEHIKR